MPVQQRQQTRMERQLEDRAHVLDILNFTENAIGVLDNQNINSVIRIITTPRNVYDGMVSQFRPAWTSTDTEQIVLFKKWFNNYREVNDGEMPTDWIQEFTDDSFYAFAINEAQGEEKARANHSFGSFNPGSSQGIPQPPEEEEPLYEPVDTSFDSFIQGGPDPVTPMSRPKEEYWDGIQQQVAAKPEIKSYPTFDGDLNKWKLFKDKFLAVATSQQMVTLLLPQYALPRQPQALERHRNANMFLFSALLFATAGGTAATVVKRHELTQDGRLAWLNLRKWYEGQGSKNSIARRALQTLQNLTLARDTVGGAEAYISAFEDALTSLEEVGEPYSENLKKMTFLNGIVDPSYSALHDILMEDDNKKYADCILALRKKAVDTEENRRGRRPLRRVAANLRPESQEQDG